MYNPKPRPPRGDPGFINMKLYRNIQKFLKARTLSDPSTRNRAFWTDAFAITGSTSPAVLPRTAIFGAIATAITWFDAFGAWSLGIEVAPLEYAGAVLGVLLVARTNAGYERWWEARKLWGTMTNRCRDLVVAGMAHGPLDRAWRDSYTRTVASFPHVVAHYLRNEREIPEVVKLVGEEIAAKIVARRNMPTAAVGEIAAYIREARSMGIDGFDFLALETLRASVLDISGGCERILGTPLPRIVAIVIRRFIFLYLATLPFALVSKLSWWTPVIVMLVAYPILSLDQMGVELENPFDKKRLNHLPMGEYAARIELDAFEALAEASEI